MMWAAAQQFGLCRRDVGQRLKTPDTKVPLHAAEDQATEPQTPLNAVFRRLARPQDDGADRPVPAVGPAPVASVEPSLVEPSTPNSAAPWMQRLEAAKAAVIEDAADAERLAPPSTVSSRELARIAAEFPLRSAVETAPGPPAVPPRLEPWLVRQILSVAIPNSPLAWGSGAAAALSTTGRPTEAADRTLPSPEVMEPVVIARVSSDHTAAPAPPAVDVVAHGDTAPENDDSQSGALLGDHGETVSPAEPDTLEAIRAALVLTEPPLPEAPEAPKVDVLKVVGFEGFDPEPPDPSASPARDGDQQSELPVVERRALPEGLAARWRRGIAQRFHGLRPQRSSETMLRQVPLDLGSLRPLRQPAPPQAKPPPPSREPETTPAAPEAAAEAELEIAPAPVKVPATQTAGAAPEPEVAGARPEAEAASAPPEPEPVALTPEPEPEPEMLPTPSAMAAPPMESAVPEPEIPRAQAEAAPELASVPAEPAPHPESTPASPERAPPGPAEIAVPEPVMTAFEPETATPEAEAMLAAPETAVLEPVLPAAEPEPAASPLAAAPAPEPVAAQAVPPRQPAPSEAARFVRPPHALGVAPAVASIGNRSATERLHDAPKAAADPAEEARVAEQEEARAVARQAAATRLPERDSGGLQARRGAAIEPPSSLAQARGRRLYRRVVLEAEIEIDGLPCRLIDLSVGGFAVADAPPDLASESVAPVRLRMVLDGIEIGTTARAHIVYAGEARAAGRFIELTGTQTAVLRYLVTWHEETLGRAGATTLLDQITRRTERASPPQLPHYAARPRRRPRSSWWSRWLNGRGYR